MTALAMIIGMAPMALSAEQNAPLGRAVIGGLIFATVATLIFVPGGVRHGPRPKVGRPRPRHFIRQRDRLMNEQFVSAPPRKRSSAAGSAFG